MTKSPLFLFARVLTLCAFGCVVSACVSKTPYLDAHFGESVNLIKAQQTLNPQAGLNTSPVNGIDGKAGKSAYDEYQKSFRVPEPQPSAFTIGVGSRQ